MGKNRVFWGPEEERLVVDNFISMYGYDATQKLEKHCMSAQKVLPPKRRRPWSEALRKSMRAAIVARAAAGAPPVQAPIPQKASEELSAETTQTAPSDYVPPTDSTGKRRKIYWDDAERDAVVKAALQLGAPDRGDSESRLRLAMEVLPVERRRPPTDPSLKSWLNKEVKKALAAPPAPPVAAAPAPTPQPAPAPAPEPVVVSPAANGAASYEGLTIEEEDDFDIPRTVGEQFAEGCGVVIGHMLTTALTYGPLKDAVRAMIATALGQATGAVTTPEKAASFNTTPNPLRKPRVLIAGLKDNLVERMQKAFPQLVLRNWTMSKSMDQLRNTTTEADITIGITSILSHSADALMAKRSKTYVRTNGITSLKHQLEKIAKSGPALH